MANVLKQLLGLGILVTALGATCVHAASITVTIGELDAAIDQMEGNPDAIERLVRSRLERALDDADLQLNAGELLFSDVSENLVDDDSCTRTEIRRVETTAALASDTALNFSLSSIYEPVELNLDITARIEAAGRAKQLLGIRLGSCRYLAEDNFSFSATGQIFLSLSLRLELNPVLDAEFQKLVLRPVISLDGTLRSSQVSVDVDDSLLRSVLENLLEDEIDDVLTDSELVEALVRLESDLESRLDDELEQGSITIDLPAPDDEQVSRLYTVLSPQGDFSLSLGYLRVRRVELMAALVTGDEEALNDLLANAALCTAAAILQSPLRHPTLYQLAGDGCERLADGQLAGNDGSVAMVYSDEQCLTRLDYQPTSDIEYCNYVLDTERLGNAQARPDTLDRWTLSPGTRFDIGAVPLSGLTQPFTQRVNFKQVSTAQGECALEMRIHTLEPDASGSSLKPLIAFHGGSWQRRSSGALGIESVATLFANQGYVVFAPFYRLIGTAEGTAACNDASLSDVLDDASDALDWVQANAATYGAQGKPVVFGQSAGGHMSAVLAVERPQEIVSAVLFYAPTDFTHFARQIISGEIDSRTGQSILETVVGQTLETLDLNAPLIRRNTLTARVVDSGSDTPPFFLLHGLQDTVLPFDQSVRFCDALAGDPDAGKAADAVASVSFDPFRRVIQCDLVGSELHLITEGEHALDLCISEDLCLAGSPLSAQATTESVQRMLDWVQLMDQDPLDTTIQADADAPMVDDAVVTVNDATTEPVAALNDELAVSEVSSGGSLGAFSGLLLLASLLEKCWRRRLSTLATQAC